MYESDFTIRSSERSLNKKISRVKIMNGKLILLIILIAVVVFAIFRYYYGAKLEGFWDIPARTWKVERVFQEPGSIKGSCESAPDFFQTPHFQGILSPRFSNVNYGPNLRTQLPGYATTGVPADPLGGMVGGSFSAAQSGCASGPTVIEGFNGVNSPYRLAYEETDRVLLDPHNPSSYANGNYNEMLAAGVASNDSDNSMVPAGSYLTADGELKQPIIYDRYLYANRQSRLRNLGDPIRGDLPIVPASGNWFTPSVHPNIDLQAGAINVLAGVNNETNHQLANLIYNSSGGGDTTIGGVDMTRMNMSNQIFGATAAARGDVIMTSFP